MVENWDLTNQNWDITMEKSINMCGKLGFKHQNVDLG